MHRHALRASHLPDVLKKGHRKARERLQVYLRQITEETFLEQTLDWKGLRKSLQPSRSSSRQSNGWIFWIMPFPSCDCAEPGSPVPTVNGRECSKNRCLYTKTMGAQHENLKPANYFLAVISMVRSPKFSVSLEHNMPNL